VHRARQGAGAVKKPLRRTQRLPARGWGCGDGCCDLRAACTAVLGMAVGACDRGDPTTTPAAAARRGAALSKRRRSRPAPGKRDRGSSFEAFRGLPVDRSTVSTRQPPPAGAPDARGGVSQGDEVSKSGPVGRPARTAGPGCVSVRPFAFPRQLPRHGRRDRGSDRDSASAGTPRERRAEARNPAILYSRAAVRL
jgi:hypothetical protein